MEKIWLNSYPAGVPAEIDPRRYGSLVAMLEESFAQFADQVAFLSMGREITYREVDRQSRDFAAWLQAQGYGRGQRVEHARCSEDFRLGEAEFEAHDGIPHMPR